MHFGRLLWSWFACALLLGSACCNTDTFTVMQTGAGPENGDPNVSGDETQREDEGDTDAQAVDGGPSATDAETPDRADLDGDPADLDTLPGDGCDSANPEITVTFVTPSANALVIGTTKIEVEVSASSKPIAVAIYAGEELIGRAQAAPYRLAWDTMSFSNGVTMLRAVALVDTQEAASTLRQVTVFNEQRAPWPGTYSGSLGANLYSDGVEFSVWWRDSVASAVSVAGDFNAWDTTANPMRHLSAEPYKDVWFTFVPGVRAGATYRFVGALAGGDRWVADVYSKYNRYADGDSVVVDDDYPWTDGNWTRPEWTRYIIYELHVQDFSGTDDSVAEASRGKYRGVTNRMKYLRDLGVTAIELMPPSEFQDWGHSWGYNPALLRAVESSYADSPLDGQGGVEEMKELINAAHGMGIAVVFDMTFNHIGGNNHFWAMDPIPWFDANGNGNPNDDTTPWGPKFNTNHAVVKKYAKDVCEYFMRQLHVDGFRFDATHSGWMSHTFLKELKAHLVAIDPNVYFVMENLPNETDLRTLGAQWAGDYHHRGVELLTNGGSVDAASFAKYIYYTRDDGWAASPVEAVNYFESHDEDSLASVFEHKSLGVDTQKRKTRLAIVLLSGSLGTPMLMAGQELLFSRHGQPPQPRPIDWSLLERNRDIYDYYAFVLRLRRDNPALRPSSESSLQWQYAPWSGDRMIIGWSMATGNPADKKFVILCNFAPDARSVRLGFPDNGRWTRIVDGPLVGGTATTEVAGGGAEVRVEGSSAVVFMK